MSQHQFKINHRPLSMFSELPQDISLEKNKNTLFDLSYKGLLKVIGERGSEFLQGQLTCDMNQVTEKTMRQGIMCNLKGRILALLDVFYHQELSLLLPKDLMESTQQTLSKTAQFSRVKLQPDDDQRVYGFYYQNSEDLMPCELPWPCSPFQMIESSTLKGYHLGQGLFILIADAKAHRELILPFEQQDQWRSALAWHTLALSHGHLSIYPESRGLFLPHRLGLQHSGHISFDKGCYKGQEIIARTHYKAKLKHELLQGQIKTSEALYSGQTIFDETGMKPLGELIDYAPTDSNQYLVAVSILKERTEMLLFEGHEHTVAIKN